MKTKMITNLSADRAALLRADLDALPAGCAITSLTVIDRSVAPGNAADADRPAAAGAPPVAIAERWEWDRRRQSYRIEGAPDAPVISGGGPEGAMYGFYRWLRDAGGCRWPYLDDSGNRVGLPPRPLPAGLVTPAIAWRGFEGGLKHWDLPFLERLMRWMLRNGWNLLLFNATQWNACHDAAAVMRLAQTHGIRLVLGAHAVETFLPETLFQTHPEYFGLRNGVRTLRADTTFPDLPGRVSRLPVQPCYGNPAVRRFLAGQIAAFIDANPGISAFSLWPHDGSNNWCECPACRCDTPYRLLHALAREILEQTRHPVPIEMLAYCNLLTPPTADLPPDPRIYTLFCPYLRAYRHRLDAPGFPPARQCLGRGWPAPQPVSPADDREYGRLFDEWLPSWRQCRSGLGIFAYYQLAFVDHTCGTDRSRYLYHPDLELVAHEIRRFHTAGMGAFYDCSWPLPGLWPDARYSEVLGRLLWDPAADPAALASAFYTDMFGPQGTAVQEALSRIDAALNDSGRPPVPRSLLDAAREAVAGLEASAANRFRLWIEYVDRADRSWQARRAGDQPAIQAAEAAVQDLLASNREALAPYLQVDWMERTARGWAQVPCATRAT